jgi:MFS family permease
MSGLVTSQAFAGLISAGILQGMDGVTRVASWRWLFILEGAFTVLIAVGAFFVLPDFPHSTKWLTQDERICAMYRLAADVGREERVDSEGVSVWQGLRLAAKDYRVWCFATMQMASRLKLVLIMNHSLTTASRIVKHSMHQLQLLLPYPDQGARVQEQYYGPSH